MTEDQRDRLYDDWRASVMAEAERQAKQHLLRALEVSIPSELTQRMIVTLPSYSCAVKLQLPISLT